MMVWHLACHRGSVFAGFAPMSGTFWEPLPTRCPGGPVNPIHYHGNEDPAVPILGRPVKDAHQGSVYAAIDLITQAGDYYVREASLTADMDCGRQEDSAGHVVELCNFRGGHVLKPAHLERAWQIFDKLSGR